MGLCGDNAELVNRPLIMGVVKMKVIFLKHCGEVLALFPYEIYSRNGLVMSYCHYGQHGGASLSLMNECKKAKKAEYLPLQNELIAIGYDELTVLN